MGIKPGREFSLSKRSLNGTEFTAMVLAGAEQAACRTRQFPECVPGAGRRYGDQHEFDDDCRCGRTEE